MAKCNIFVISKICLTPQKGYDDLQSIVPTCQQQSEFAVGTQKISKATVLQKSNVDHCTSQPEIYILGLQIGIPTCVFL